MNVQFAQHFLESSKRLAARNNLRMPHSSCRFFATVATVEKAKVPAAEGDRLIVNDPEGNPIFLAKVGGKFYAIENECPHMEKSFEKSRIITERDDEPEIQCAFHNSRFSLKTGMCTKWVTGALGFDNKLISGVAQKLGGEKRDVRAYRVVENENGSLTIDNDVSAM